MKTICYICSNIGKSVKMLASLKQNFEKLIALYETEKKKSADLELRLQESEKAADAYKKQIIELERQIENLKLAEAFNAPREGSARGAKEKIDQLIKEIDKCISLLEK